MNPHVVLNMFTFILALTIFVTKFVTLMDFFIYLHMYDMEGHIQLRLLPTYYNMGGQGQGQLILGRSRSYHNKEVKGHLILGLPHSREVKVTL